jgi:phage terminase small subunit
VTITAPKNLDAAGRRKWRELAPLLAEADEAALTGLTIVCQAWARLQKAETTLAGDPDNEQAQDTVARSQRVIRQWLAELRLTPKSRKAKAGDRDTGDPLLKLIGKRA